MFIRDTVLNIYLNFILVSKYSNKQLEQEMLKRDPKKRYELYELNEYGKMMSDNNSLMTPNNQSSHQPYCHTHYPTTVQPLAQAWASLRTL